MTRRLAALCLAAILWTGPARAEEATLRVVPHAPLTALDPIWTAAYVTRNHGYMVYDTLFALDETLKPRPQMVETWKVSDDKLVWTFTLRDGLTWHDGAPVTAEDCVASLRRWAARDDMGRKLMAATAELEALDAHSFEMKLRYPYGLVLESLAKPGANVPFMMPARLAATSPFEPVTEVVGSGPFKFVAAEWVPGKKAVYVRNPDYRPRAEPPSGLAGGKVVKVDRVEWLSFPDAESAAAALAKGEVDYYDQPSFEIAHDLAWTAGVVVESLDPLGVQGMVRMNHLHPPFNNVKGRQALLKLIDQPEMLRAAIGDPKYFRECYSYFTCGSPLATEAGSEPYRRKNVEDAKRLFQEAGYKGEKVVVLHVTDIRVPNVATTVLAQALREAGVNVELQAMDWAGVTARRAMKEAPERGGWSIFLGWNVGTETLNPVSELALDASCEKAWFGWPCDEGMQKLRVQFAREPDPGKRIELARQIQIRNYQEVVTHGNFGVWFHPSAYRRSLKGLLSAPAPVFWNVEKVEEPG
jgi:peptide/nickel transport system substrate-binding protein